MIAAQLKDVQEELVRRKATPDRRACHRRRAGGGCHSVPREIAALTTKLAQATDQLSQLQQANQKLTDGNARLQAEKDSFWPR